MAYDHFGAPIKSTEVALAAFTDAVESVKSHPFSGTAFMKPATTLPAVRVASSSVRDPMLAATNLASQLSHEKKQKREEEKTKEGVRKKQREGMAGRGSRKRKEEEKR